MTEQVQPGNQANDNNRPAVTAVRCKVCGYIIDAGKVRDLCPACGVKAAMFEPLVEKFSDSRRKFLNRHVHPIIVHFPQALAGTLLTAAMLMLVTSGAFRQALAGTVTVLSAALPFIVVASFTSGIIDGRVRFKKTSTPFLRLKITVGAVYVVVSSVNCAVVLLTPWTTPPLTAAVAVLALGLTACTTVLGKIGAELSCARVPG